MIGFGLGVGLFVIIVFFKKKIKKMGEILLCHILNGLTKESQPIEAND